MAQEKKERIFISYKRVDKERVFAIKDGIERATGEKCWIDLDGIESDAQFVAKIMGAIDECDVFLFMRSKEHNKIKVHELETDWTIREVNYALGEKKRIVFLNLDNTPMPKWFKFMFPNKQEIDATDSEKLKHLYSDLCVWLGVKPINTEPSVQPIPKTTPKPLKKSWIWLAIAAVVMIVLAVLGVRYFQKRPTIDLLVDTEQYVQDSIPQVQIQDGIAKETKTTNDTPKSTQTTSPQSVSSTQKDIANSSSNAIKKAETQQERSQIEEKAKVEAAKPTTTTTTTITETQTKKTPTTSKTSNSSNTIDIEQAKRDALPEGEFKVGDLKYKASESSSGVTVCGRVNKAATEIHIPSQIDYGHYTYDVTSIGEGAFQLCSGLTSITIPNSVTRIGNAAFSGCDGLTSITIPNSVTSIGYYAFYDCSSLTSLTIPNSVTSIGSGAFSSCSNLISITIPNNVTGIGHWAFDGCSGLTSLTIPNSVTGIGDHAFCNCSSLTSITIPNSVTSIGNGAFSGCDALKSVKIPKTLTDIGYDAFPEHTQVIRE